MERLPRDVVHYLLDFCHPIDYVAFLKTGKLAYPVNEKQRDRKKKEFKKCMENFSTDYALYIVRSVMHILCDIDQMDIGGEEEIICFLNDNLENLWLKKPWLWRKAFFQHHKRNERFFMFPSPEEVKHFIDFVLHEDTDFTGGLVSLTNHKNFEKLLKFTKHLT
jgi:hypothetical protein